MSQNQLPTYHLPPNFSIGPFPNGPIELGSILKSIKSEVVLNDECHHKIPQEKLYCHHKMGFHATRERLIKSEFGIWARFLGIAGFGGEASWAYEKTREDEYHFKGEDTIYFNPSLKYMKDSMNEEDVKEFVKGTGYRPVYMVTGLKIARGPSVKLKKYKRNKPTLKLNMEHNINNAGPGVSGESTEKDEEGWDKSDDFITGIRVLKLVYTKAWFAKGSRKEIQAKDYNHGAVLVDANDLVTSKGHEENDVLDVALDVELEGMKAEYDGDTVWMIPNPV